MVELGKHFAKAKQSVKKTMYCTISFMYMYEVSLGKDQGDLKLIVKGG